MKLKVNGELVETEDQITLKRLLDNYGLQPETIAVEINFEIIPRFKYADTVLKEEDNIEIVHFVGGG
jgi:sulfur carrier protein